MTGGAEGGGMRHAAGGAALLFAAATVAAGCHFPISPEVVLKPETATKAVRAPAANDLAVGVRRLALRSADGEPVDVEAGDERALGYRFAEDLRDALIFKEVHYPLRDEAVDVILEPTLVVSLTKNRGTNALKVLPGLILPWIDGLGFDYDYTCRLEVAVRNPKRAGALCDTLQGESAMIAERYPSILWFLGIHVGLIILTIFESVTTDTVVLQRLVETAYGRAEEPVLRALADELGPVAKPCALHPDEEQPGRYCIIDGRDLYYPLLFRGEPAPP